MKFLIWLIILPVLTIPAWAENESAAGPVSFFHVLWPDYFPENFSVRDEADMRRAMIRLAASPKIAVEVLSITEEALKIRLRSEELTGDTLMLDAFQRKMRESIANYYRMRGDLKEEAKVYARLLVAQLAVHPTGDYRVSLAITSLRELMKPALYEMIQLVENGKGDLVSEQLKLCARLYGLPENIQLILTKIEDPNYLPQRILAQSDMPMISEVRAFMIESLRTLEDPTVLTEIAGWLYRRSRYMTGVKSAIAEQLLKHTVIDEVRVLFIYLNTVGSAYYSTWKALEDLLKTNSPKIILQLLQLAIDIPSPPDDLVRYFFEYNPSDTWDVTQISNFQYLMDELRETLPRQKNGLEQANLVSKNCFDHLNPENLQYANDNR